MKKIVITEANFEDILKRIKKITDHYMVNNWYDCFDAETGKKKFSNPGIRIYRSFYEKITHNKQGEIISIKKKLACNFVKIFVETEKHRFRQMYEDHMDDLDSPELSYLDKYDIELYLKRKTYIRCGTSPVSARILSDGDQIRFLPFNLGFVTYTDDKDIQLDDKPKSIYRDISIKIPFKKINFEAMCEARRLEEEESDKYYVPADYDEYDAFYEEGELNDIPDYSYYDCDDMDDEDDESKGYTVTFISWDDCKPRVAGRFKTRNDLEDFLNKVYEEGSGWVSEELESISIQNDYNFMLPY